MEKNRSDRINIRILKAFDPNAFNSTMFSLQYQRLKIIWTDTHLGDIITECDWNPIVFWATLTFGFSAKKATLSKHGNRTVPSHITVGHAHSIPTNYPLKQTRFFPSVGISSWDLDTSINFCCVIEERDLHNNSFLSVLTRSSLSSWMPYFYWLSRWWTQHTSLSSCECCSIKSKKCKGFKIIGIQSAVVPSSLCVWWSQCHSWSSCRDQDESNFDASRKESSGVFQLSWWFMCAQYFNIGQPIVVDTFESDSQMKRCSWHQFEPSNAFFALTTKYMLLNSCKNISVWTSVVHQVVVIPTTSSVSPYHGHC